MKLPDKKYQIIVADPPWQLSKVKQDMQKFNKPASFDNIDYPMMSLEEIKALPIRDIADDKCTLFLWTIDKYLYDAKPILEHWGFKYHLTMAWDKGNGIALYGFNRQTEFVLVGFKGKHKTYPQRKTIRTSFAAKSERHSAKPDAFYMMLDVLEGDRIDLFARQGRDTLFGHHWDVWGNEC